MSGSLKSRLRGGIATVGGWAALGSPQAAEVLARAGYDWVAIDLEHTGISLDQASACIAAIRHHCPALVRLPSADPVLAKRVLDCGAEGLIVPDVRDLATLTRMHAAMHYPPSGTRGVGLWRAQGWGADFDAYRTGWPERAVLVAQIESGDAMRNLRELLSFDGLDAAMVGPYDLSASLGTPGELDAPRVVQAVAEVRAVGRELNRAVGVHVVEPDPAALRRALDSGDQFVAYGVDFRFLDASARAGLAEARRDG
ncbi:MAG: 2,4-dihydroxyhept-2-ene-1,7-dioic acid aldolase [Proteobacteria bacterium]|nr:2,4-dihydroxyhept-2-ene-1,7-dioic acid aldolase [Pseudomonadota bacterium]